MHCLQALLVYRLEIAALARVSDNPRSTPSTAHVDGAKMPEGRLGEAKVPDADLELVEGRLGKANMPGADPELVTRGGSSSGGGGSNGSTTSAGGVGSSSSTATSTAGSLDPRARLVRASLGSWAPATPGDPSSNRMQTAGETIGRKQAAAPPQQEGIAPLPHAPPPAPPPSRSAQQQLEPQQQPKQQQPQQQAHQAVAATAAAVTAVPYHQGGTAPHP